MVFFLKCVFVGGAFIFASLLMAVAYLLLVASQSGFDVMLALLFFVMSWPFVWMGHDVMKL